MLKYLVTPLLALGLFASVAHAVDFDGDGKDFFDEVRESSP